MIVAKKLYVLVVTIVTSANVNGREYYARGTSLFNRGPVLPTVAHELLALARAASRAIARLALHLRRAPATAGLLTAVTSTRVLTAQHDVRNNSERNQSD